LIKTDDLRAGMGFLARWFKFQPSEIDALEVDEFSWWCDEGLRQVKIENAA
jgi:hypothetical protein